jgi:hypothetical protein
MIEAKRVRLRAGTANDRDRVLTSLNDWTIAEWLPGVPFPYTPKDAADFLELHCTGTLSSAFIIADRGRPLLLCPQLAQSGRTRAEVTARYLKRVMKRGGWFRL